MSKRLRGISYFFFLESRFTLMIFFLIFFISLIPITILQQTLDAEVVIFSSFHILILAIILGMTFTKETFPFSIRMGATRLEYLLASTLFIVALSAFVSAVNIGITSLFSTAAKAISGQEVKMYHMADFVASSSTIPSRFITDFTLFLLLMVSTFFISAMMHRTGLAGTAILFGTAAVLLLVPQFRSEAQSALVSIDSVISLNYTGIFSLILVFLIMIYLLLVRSSIVPSSAR